MSFLCRYSESADSSISNSLTEAEDEFNGEVVNVPGGYSQIKEPNENQSSHSCIETVEDSSVPNTESTGLYALFLIQLCVQRIHLLSSYDELSRICLVKNC